MFVSNLQTLGMPVVIIKDDENLQEYGILPYAICRVRKRVKWWQRSKPAWFLRAGDVKDLPQPAASSAIEWWPDISCHWCGKCLIALKFISGLPPELEGGSVHHGGILIKKGNGYLVYSGGNGESPDKVTINLLRSVGLPAGAFGTPDEPMSA